MFLKSILPFATAALICCSYAMPAQAASPSSGKCIAVFEFELLDMSLEGEIKGSNKIEQQRLGLMAPLLRNWLNAKGYLDLCDMSPVAAEARASNLYACGCIQRLAGRVGGKFAVVGSVHKLSNLILFIGIEVFEVDTDRRVMQFNADIRSNSDRSWTRGLEWLIEHRLAGAFGYLKGVEL